ncbi:MAG TPA: aminodeoxychorismate synthase component I [Solirubrobacteraceae bacterium]|nr:aminodeoxychorismate synthase component I [Solirubrobacteraceae bacterium]
MRTLLIDNYDSYTFNLFHLLGEVNGEEPLVVHNDALSWPELERWDVDNVVISPGPGRPEHPRDVGVSLDALQRARVPVLGVCLGHQALALVAGGRVAHAPAPMHGRLSPIEHDGRGLFAGVPQAFQAVRYHSLVVEDLPPELRVTAWTPDGVVMGLEHRDRPLYGVQFHPESVMTEHGARLLENFRDVTRARRPECLAAPRRPAVARPPADGAPRPAVRVRHRRLEGAVDAEAAFAALLAGRRHAVWLDSARAEPGVARFSYLGWPGGRLGRVLRYDVAAGRLTVARRGTHGVRDESVFAYCARELERLRADAPELPFDFVGGFAGYLGYELKAECGARHAHVSPHPDAGLVLCDRLVVIDHLERHTYLVALEAGDGAAVDEWLDETAALLRDVRPLPAPADARPGRAAFHLLDDTDRYRANIEACRRQIVEGETYEVCLTTELRSAATVEPFAGYRALRACNPAPFAALLRLGELSVLSSSPERFLRVDRSRTVESKPIKGTTARSADPVRDARLRDKLRASADFRAENLMIADLVRNDLGRVCELGSIHVPGLMVVESHATVHQLVSVVRGTLRPGVGALDAVRASFPGGSMTGAPKLRTMEIIDELEGRPRGVYSGALGFLSVNGTADLNIVIRTLVVTPRGMSIGSGGAILAGSDADAEVEEMLLKARAVLGAIGGTVVGAPAAAAGVR